MTHDLPPTIDPAAAARWLRAAPPLSPWLHEEVARRMEDRLQWITLKPAAWAHWDAVRGGLQAHGLLAQRFFDATCFVAETNPARAEVARAALAQPWWKPSRWTGPQAQFTLPPDGSVQMLWANMALHMAADPQALIAQWHRALAVDGYVMFSCLGPDTARELRGLYADLGWPPAGHAFTDMHDWGDMLVAAGFAEPVMDMERITLSYSSAQSLLDELRQLGRNLHAARFSGLRGRGWRSRWLDAVQSGLTTPGESGRLTLTFEVVYGHAFKPQRRLTVAPQTAISLEEMRLALRQPRTGPV